ncbi:MAG: antitoxin [Prochlorococcaceae cyanobacterium]
MRAKLFRNGRSQAVRLPAEFRFEGTEVEVHRDPASGAVVLTAVRPSARAWLESRNAVVQRPEIQADISEVLAELRDSSAPQPRGWP